MRRHRYARSSRRWNPITAVIWLLGVAGVWNSAQFFVEKQTEFGFLVLGVTVVAILVAIGVVKWGGAKHREAVQQRLAHRQRSLDDLRRLSWQEFEQVCAAAYRKRGWTAQIQGGGGADGGIDLVLSRPSGKRWLVQCKHYQGRVGIKVVREMFGLLAHENAQRMVIIATSGFTKECWPFVQGKPIELMDGKRLIAFLHDEPDKTLNPSGKQSTAVVNR